MPSAQPPTIYLIAGPNGAGKSAIAGHFLPSRVGLERYVNPDVIATGLNPVDPWAARRQAGQRALERIGSFVEERLDFAVETTLSGHWTTRLVHELREGGWLVDLSFLWLPNAELAVERVRLRVDREGGHGIPADDVRRRHARGLVNFDALWPVLDRWRVVDSRRIAESTIVASGARNEMVIHEPVVWQAVLDSIRTARRGGDAVERGGGGRNVSEQPAERARGAYSRGGVMSRAQSTTLANDGRDIPGEAPEASFAAANRATVLRHRVRGIPLLFWENGRTVEVDPWTVPLPRVPETDDLGKLVSAER